MNPLLTLALALLLPCVALAETPAVPLQTVEPPQRLGVVRDVPVSVGVVFPDGELASPQVGGGRVLDDRGQEVDFEAEATGWWDREKSRVKWLLLHFRASSDRRYTFIPGPAASRPTGATLARQDGQAIVIDTGPLRVRLCADQPALLDDVTLHGQAMLKRSAAPLTLIADDGAGALPCTLRQWALELEQSTPQRAGVKAHGIYEAADGRPIARLDLRYQFFRGQPIVRVYHTLTWMVQDVAAGVRDLSLTLQPALGSTGVCRVGLSDVDASAHEQRWSHSSAIIAHQSAVDRFSIVADGQTTHEGRRLGGWVELAGDDGRGVSLSVRHAWQRYPLAFSLHGQTLGVALWPPQSQRMSFAPEALMGEKIYRHESWNRFDFVKGRGHFVNNYEGGRDFMYTAEGAAFTHELLIGFHDAKTQRSGAELNHITQWPIVLRQDPALAMRVPFMGFDIMPVQAGKYPDIERAVHQLGRLALARWESENNFGLLRFGMVRWGQHGPPYYRWMDNTQYDQQMIPWLLFMRGGDRQFFDDGEITARYAMDMNVNHYNTRNSPTGYMATCGGALPTSNFPFVPYNMKGQKLHFLAYYYHLTGYPRAKDVLDEVIDGTRTFTRDHAARHGPQTLAGGREAYNMNTFWASAYEETLDPEVAQFARDSRQVTIQREYKPDTNTFDPPVVYLYNGLVFQHRLFGDDALREVMLRHLGLTLLKVDELGGIGSVENVIGCPWAYEQTQDRRYAKLAWDVARGLAELVPNFQLDGPNVPYYPYAYLGNAIVRHHLMPILTGASLGHRLGMDVNEPTAFGDLYVYLRRDKLDQPARGEVFVRARRDGALSLRVLAKSVKNAPLFVALFDAEGRELQQLQLERMEHELVQYRGELSLANVRAGATYRIELRSDDQPTVAVLGDAMIVHHLPAAERHAQEPLSGGQNFTACTLVSRAEADTIAYLNRVKLAYTVRDALSGDLLLRPVTYDDAEARVKVGQGRMIQLTVAGGRAPAQWFAEGLAPYFAAKAEDWFDPRKP